MTQTALYRSQPTPVNHQAKELYICLLLSGCFSEGVVTQFLCGQIASPARQLLNFFPLFLCFLCQLFLRLGLIRSDTKIYLIHTRVNMLNKFSNLS